MYTIRRGTRGWSLLEAVVAAALLLLCLAALYELLVPGLRAWTISNRRSHLRQGVLSTITRVSHDLKLTCVESVVIIPAMVLDPDTGRLESSDAVSFLWAFDERGEFLTDSEDGRPAWQRYEVIYHDPNTRQVHVGWRSLDRTRNVERRLSAFTRQPLTDPVIGRLVRGLAVKGRPRGSPPSGTPEPRILRANPFSIEVRGRDEDEECSLETSVSTLLVGNPAYADE